MNASLENRLGDQLLISITEPRWSSSFERQLQSLRPGGLLLAGPMPESPEATREFLYKTTQCLASRPFLAVREEGGARGLLASMLPVLPPPRSIAKKGATAVEQMGELVGEALSRLGFNANFAPSLDLATPFTERTLGARVFGSVPAHVAESGGAFARGLRRHGILACGKHFPGWGSVPPADGRELSQSGKPMAGLWREDLLPFRANLPQLPMVLLSNAAYKAYDFYQPRAAALSSQVVEGLLRTKLGYRGLAIACDLESAVVREPLSLGDAAVRAIDAGCDILIVDKEESWLTMRQALAGALETGKLSLEWLDQSFGRIRLAKKGLARPASSLSERAWNRLVRRYEEFISMTQTQGEMYSSIAKDKGRQIYPILG